MTKRSVGIAQLCREFRVMTEGQGDRIAVLGQLKKHLDSPEVMRLVATLEYVRWTGRPGYPVRAMMGMQLVKELCGLRTWSQTVRLVECRRELQTVFGCAPSLWACYRFARMLREVEEAVAA